jgi:ADP-ribose pyrophosphatase YjhB (NUDIX family)
MDVQRTVKVGIKHEPSGKYLMIRRENRPDIPYPDLWDAAGGGKEPGETALQTALRESSEETGGIQIYDLMYLGQTSTIERRDDQFVHTILDMYLAKTRAPLEEVKVAKGEGQAAGYFTLEEIAKMNTVPHLKELASKYGHILEAF